MTKRQGATSENGFILEKLTKIEKEKIIFSELFRKSFHLSTYIYLWIEMKSFPPPSPQISNFMHGLKSTILVILQKLADWLDWPSKTAQCGFFSLLYTELLKTSNSTLKRKQFFTPREGNPGYVLLTSRICLRYFHQCVTQ